VGVSLLEELKPCPFCGNGPKIVKDGSGWLIQCKSCCASSGLIVKDHFDDDRKAVLIANWNRRAAGWINDKRPSLKTRILILLENNKIVFGRLLNDDIWELEGRGENFEDVVSHWQPLPELPVVNKG
jgi:hypothetical protein